MIPLSEIGLTSTLYKETPSYRDLYPIREFLDTSILKFPGVFLAGAALQSLIHPNDTINDYDIFFEDISWLYTVEATLKLNGFEKIPSVIDIEKVKMSYFIRHDMKINLIYVQEYKSMEACIKTFDFTCTMFAFDGKELITSKRAREDTKNKVLKINVLNYPTNTLKRVDKYVEKKGYTIEPITLDRIEFMSAKDENSFFYEGDEREAIQIGKQSRRGNGSMCR